MCFQIFKISKSDEKSDPCQSRGLQKVVDLARLPYEVAYSSDYYHYTLFFNKYDDTDVLTVDDQYEESYQEEFYYDPDNLYIFPNQTQYFKLRDFLAKSANERNKQAILLNGKLHCYYTVSVVE